MNTPLGKERVKIQTCSEERYVPGKQELDPQNQWTGCSGEGTGSEQVSPQSDAVCLGVGGWGLLFRG